MGIDIKVNIEFTPRQKRVVRGAVIASTVVAVLGVGVAFAIVPNTFNTGDSLSSSKMNQNFSSLDTRITSLEATRVQQTSDGGYSVNATYCGITATTAGDLSGLSASGSGYVKAKAACVSSCGGNPAAHMCTSEEMIRSAAAGAIMPGGWYSAGTYAQNSSNNIYDCKGWTSNAGTDDGSWWNNAQNRPAYDHCSSSSDQVLCCD